MTKVHVLNEKQLLSIILLFCQLFFAAAANGVSQKSTIVVFIMNFSTKPLFDITTVSNPEGKLMEANLQFQKEKENSLQEEEVGR